MAYVPKPGSASLFENDRKQTATQPDLKGDGMLPDGTPIWISAWKKESARGEFLSVSIQVKDGAKQTKPKAKPAHTFDEREGGFPADDLEF